MSYFTTVSSRLPGSATERVDFTLSGNPIDNDQGISVTDEETISLQDLLNSPEFIEEQKLILLEIETAQLCIAEGMHSVPVPSPERQAVNHRRSRRSSIGIKLTCPVCLESLSSVRTLNNVKMVTQCGHIFCQDCIESVCEATNKLCKKEDDDFDVKTLCPVCREEIGELRKVFF